MKAAVCADAKKALSELKGSAVIDPRRVSETSSFGGLDASRLRVGATNATTHRFPRADAAGKVDWNRDDRAFVLGDEGNLRGTLVLGSDACKFHARVSDVVAPISGVTVSSPDVAGFGSRLYAFFVSSTPTQIAYRSIQHSGANDKAGCEVGTAGADVTSSCHDFLSKPTFTLNVSPPTPGVISTVAALPWQGKMVVAYRITGGADDRKVFVNVASAVSASGEFTDWAGSPTLVTSDSDSRPPDMRRRSPCFSAEPRSEAPSVMMPVFGIRLWNPRLEQAPRADGRLLGIANGSPGQEFWTRTTSSSRRCT